MTNMLLARIDEVLAIDRLGELVAAYFDDNPESPFAGELFDTLGDNPQDTISRDDLLAVSLLDVRFSPRAVRRLLNHELDDDLHAIDPSTPIWAFDEWEKLLQLYERLVSVPGVGRTKATKLLSRKRPELVPIRDSVVESVLGIGSRSWWKDLASVLVDSDRRIRLTALRPAGVRVSVLRVLDVGIWMLGSNSATARKQREKAGLDPQPLRAK